MAIGNEIVISSPYGRKVEGIISGTPKPGTVMQIKAATAAVGGRLTWEVYNAAADGDQRLIAVLDIDHLQGKISTDAYVDGQHGFLWVPLPGDELNMLVSAPGTGTGDAIAIGDLFMVNDGDGLLVDTTGSPESEPFQAIEAVSDVVSTGTLVACVYTGH